MRTVLKLAVTSSDFGWADTAAGVCVVGDDEDETSEYEQPVTARHVTDVRSVCTAGFDDYYAHKHTLVHQALSRNSASYLADDCRLVADARERRLRSTESRTCVVTRNHSTFGDRTFAAASSGVWNSLLPHLRDADLPWTQFRQSLKTFLFG